jgi:hypothetical protein
MVKRLPILVALALVSVPAMPQQSETAFWFGENRASLPGPEILSSIYAENPALTAESAQSSVSLAGMAFPSLGSQSLLAGTGLSYSLSIPNFALVNITETAATDQPSPMRIDLLGIQLGLSTRDIAPQLPFRAAAGVSLMRINGASGSMDRPADFQIDLGLLFAFSLLRIEALGKGLVALGASGISAFGPSAEYGVKVGGKIILDIEYSLGASVSPAYQPADLAASVKFSRSFFSNSLFTGIELDARIDFDAPENALPLVQYGMSVSYILPDLPSLFGRPPGERSPLDSALSIFRNLSLDLSALIIVNNYPGFQSMRPIVGIGITKFY